MNIYLPCCQLCFKHRMYFIFQMKNRIDDKRRVPVQLNDSQYQYPISLFESIPITIEEVSIETINSMAQLQSQKQRSDKVSIKRQISKTSSKKFDQKVSWPLQQNSFQQSTTSIKCEPRKSKKHRSSTQFKREMRDFFQSKSLIKQLSSEVAYNIQLPPRDFASFKKPQLKKIQNRSLFQNTNVLSNILKKQKINALTKTFIQKISRGKISSCPIDQSYFNDEQQQSIFQSIGFQINPLLDVVLSLISIIQFFALTISYTLSLVYVQVYQSPIISILQVFSLFVYIIQIFINLITVKSQYGIKISKFNQIFRFYLRKTLIFDILNVFILFLDSFTSYNVVSYLRLFVIFKIPQSFQKLEKLQIYFIKNFYNQQYWSLAKVFLFNFCFAHILAIFLSAMASTNPTSNWMIIKRIDQSPWYERYTWSYYWGTTIMLTVGFGDIVPTNYQEALCMIFIETFSCIALAYNINCVGTLISNIRSSDVKTSQNLKIFKKLTDKTSINEELHWKINNYIAESSNIQKKFDYAAQTQFIQKLPQSLKLQYLKDSNRKILQNLVFFRTLVDRTIYKLAQKIQMKISHPQQTIKQIDDDFNLLILKQGQIGLACKKFQCALNGKIIDVIKIEVKDFPYLASLDFITKRRINYQIKSLEYSVIYQLNYNKLMETLKESDMDHELYSYLRDKIKNVPDEFQVNTCEVCSKKHYKFDCPKLHYIPFTAHIINKNQYQEKHSINAQRDFNRMKDLTYEALQIYRHLKFQRPKTTKFTTLRRKTRDIEADPTQQHTVSSFGDNNQIKSFRSFQKNEDQIIKKIKQTIKDELFALQRQKEFIDGIWLINVDQMCNFNSYFPHDNPNYLSIKFSIANQIKTQLGSSQELSDSIRQE